MTALESVRTLLKAYLENKRLTEWLSAKAPCEFEPFYSSIDLRDAGFKLAPVDANLYPAGFNNICSEDLERSGEILKPLLIRRLGRMPKRIAILPEFHTRNKFYVDNVYEIRQMFRRLGIETEVGWIPQEGHQDASQSIPLQTSDERIVQAFPFTRKGDKLVFEPFEPEMILLNNDFSAGFPEILRGLAQPVQPSAKMGWHTRKKSDFFTHYNRLAGELAQAAGIDPWQLQVATKLVDGVNFDENAGMDRIAAAVEETLENMRREYAAHGVNEQPFVFVKNNAGTYGMGVLKVESGQELLQLNRRERNKMAVGKGSYQVNDVIVQEGIPTRFQVDGVYAEPCIYLLGHDLLGGFLRKNPTRGRVDNLNSKGMVFQRLCISDLRKRDLPAGARDALAPDRDLELELVYGTIAQLSAAAIRLEIARVEGVDPATSAAAQASCELR